jgi:hypothetical protein
MPRLGRDITGEGDGEFPPGVNPLSRRCTAKSKQTGRRCRAYAILGKTVCKYHGGYVRYANVIKNPTLKNKYMELIGDDKLSDLEDDLVLLRAMTEILVLKAFRDENTTDMPVERVAIITTMIEKITRLVESINKHQQMKGQMVSAASLTKLVDTMTQILQRHIADQSVLRQIVAEMTAVQITPIGGESTSLATQ